MNYPATASNSNNISVLAEGAAPDGITAEVLTESVSSEDLITVTATPRQSSGSTISERLRRVGFTPAILFSLPGNESKLLQLESQYIQKLVEKVGRLHFTSKVMNLQVNSRDSDVSETYRVLPRLLHVNAVTEQVENVTFMHLSPGKRLKVEVPVQVIGQDLSPGIKRGGWPHITSRTISLLCPRDNVLPHIEVDVSSMNLGNSLIMEQLANMLPAGVDVLSTDPLFPICKMRGRARD